jgi:hypothetical protein
VNGVRTVRACERHMDVSVTGISAPYADCPIANAFETKRAVGDAWRLRSAGDGRGDAKAIARSLPGALLGADEAGCVVVRWRSARPKPRNCDDLKSANSLVPPPGLEPGTPRSTITKSMVFNGCRRTKADNQYVGISMYYI